MKQNVSGCFFLNTVYIFIRHYASKTDTSMQTYTQRISKCKNMHTQKEYR